MPITNVKRETLGEPSFVLRLLQTCNIRAYQSVKKKRSQDIHRLRTKKFAMSNHFKNKSTTERKSSQLEQKWSTTCRGWLTQSMALPLSPISIPIKHVEK
ncbi:hypothetical protein PU629_02215 [Pullulanibacillus sp. KACC 23026]|uniref:hypothetical protein n=1 Tax=Pullulanibacillus sp. KACC 23026 TaxID=3028315 RepID=UPI0023AEC473|nr:hypothetical protein [Pullulanibacillus sp. KACC 23026]WEG13200.1 hypothetical protein PU629_02215 [Pullulanibacillus sp. KACC 23026]